VWTMAFSTQVASASPAPIMQSLTAGIPVFDAWRLWRGVDNATFRQAFDITIAFEGCTPVNHPSDPGGKTMCGVTQGAYNTWRSSEGLPTADVFNITKAEVEQVYYDDYWLASHADVMPESLAIATFDWAVNAGVGAARRDLNHCLGNGLIMGWTDVTTALLTAQIAMGNETVLVTCLNDRRETVYVNSSNYQVFGNGWMNRLESIRGITE